MIHPPAIDRARFIGLTAAAVLGASAPSRAAALTWAPDTVHSRAEFLVSHLIVSKVWGHIPFASLSLVTNEAGFPLSAAAVLNPAKLDTDNHERDGDLRSSAFFDVAQYPTIGFESTSFAPAPKTPDGLVAFTGEGRLTIKGITRPVVLAGTIVGRIPDGPGVERIGLGATTTIDRRDFGLTDARMSPAGIPIVGNSVAITLTIEATRTT